MKVQRLSRKYLAGLGKRLKLLRTDLGLDQKLLAKALGTSQSRISQIEKGQSAPSLYQLLELKKLIEKDGELKNSISWDWILRGRGKGVWG